MTNIVAFFFQAEDGIRDIGVTGVQTCALPISSTAKAPSRGRNASSSGASARQPASRSEERRVGKECRSRWWRWHLKKTTSDETHARYYVQARAHHRVQEQTQTTCTRCVVTSRQ